MHARMTTEKEGRGKMCVYGQKVQEKENEEQNERDTVSYIGQRAAPRSINSSRYRVEISAYRSSQLLDHL